MPSSTTKPTKPPKVVICATCGEEVAPPDVHTTGYGTDKRGRKHCYACCATLDRREMETRDNYDLYWHNGEVTNWPCTLHIKPDRVKIIRHNMASEARLVWFTGPDGHKWLGRNIGDNEVLRCRKLKGKK